MDTDDGGRIQFGPQLNIIPETHMAPESGKYPFSKEGCMPIPPVSSVIQMHWKLCWKRCESPPLSSTTVPLWVW